MSEEELKEAYNCIMKNLKPFFKAIKEGKVRVVLNDLEEGKLDE